MYIHCWCVNNTKIIIKILLVKYRYFIFTVRMCMSGSIFNKNNSDTGIHNILWENNTIHNGKENTI